MILFFHIEQNAQEGFIYYQAYMLYNIFIYQIFPEHSYRYPRRNSLSILIHTLHLHSTV